MLTPRELFVECVPNLSESFRIDAARLLEPEHWHRLADRCSGWLDAPIPPTRPLPHFDVEVTPPLEPMFQPLRSVLRSGVRSRVAELAQLLESTGLANLLTLLGQRWTPGSLHDARAIPPLRATLLTAATTAHGSDGLSVLGRALAKHIHRHPSPFWGAEPLTGSASAKNARALERLQALLEQFTWWNVFGHFAHETVYEIREPSGYGARWGHDGTQLIGLLSPFDAELFPTRSERDLPS
ncbi:hypothetical protein [Tuwongella immobilis]|uniref:Uncharacterized protein n=1 Tax=Tuwongella immobilis TaxID=692036 RepID=A0A6C2YRD1_9BACT|nr:hypothetical protein [Tuwongella immobilis]VIP03911.1 Uncharacterized protein OS=Chryseobacterium gleum ATCC 35910 GN=HMPREF0204_10862 PE=4 SV=1 [Tuwongella immobilis]VTS05189.1 Uncharacterized protein OS=Chryseobacterium gleum ATCC 35910 GN=HMPREF0204_10862 PE=4 SV=1 [Tuwongella immobilis]